jgi:hypothetical protein
MSNLPRVAATGERKGFQARQFQKAEERVEAALQGELEPGETLRTWIYGRVRPSFRSHLILGPVIAPFRTRFYFVALTDRRVFVLRSAMRAIMPTNVEWAEPHAGVAVAQYKPGLLTRLYLHRVADGSELSLQVGRPFREQTLEIARALGAAV